VSFNVLEQLDFTQQEQELRQGGNAALPAHLAKVKADILKDAEFEDINFLGLIPLSKLQVFLVKYLKTDLNQL